MPFDNTNFPQDDGAATDVGAPPRSQVFPPVQPIESDNRDQATEPVVPRTNGPATKLWIRSPDERLIVENLDDLDGLTFTAPVPFADTQAALDERVLSERPMQMWAAPPHLSKSAYDLENPTPWATPWTGGAFSLGIAVGIALGGVLFSQPPTPIPEIAVAPPVMLPHSLPVPHTAITVEHEETAEAAPTTPAPRAASPPPATRLPPSEPAKTVDEIAVAPTVPVQEVAVQATNPSVETTEQPPQPITIGALSSIPIAIPGGRAVGALSEIPVAKTVLLPASLELTAPPTLTATEEAPPPAAPTGPMISFGAMDLIDFSSGAAAVNATLQAGKPGMESCYTNAAAAGSHPKGHIKLQWIALNGQPRRVSVVNTNVDNAALIGCLIIRANRWRFSNGASGAGNVIINVGG